MFYGDLKVLSQEGEAITLEDKSIVYLSSNAAEKLLTKEKSTKEDLQMQRVLVMTSEMFAIFKNYSATKREITSILQTVPENMSRHDKNILCSILGAENFMDIDFRSMNDYAIKIEDNNFTN